MLENLRTALKGSFIYSLSNIASKLIGFILMPLFMKYLSVAEYGTLGILDVTTQILLAVFGLGIWYAFERWYWDKNYIHARKSVFFSVVLFSLVLSFFLFILISFFATDLSQLLFNHSHYKNTLILMTGIAGLQIINQSPATLLRLKNKPGLFTFISITKLLVLLVLTIYLLTVKNKKVEGIYEAQFIAELVMFVFLFSLTYKELEFKFNGKALGEIIIFRLPMALSSVFVVLLSFTDRFALKFINNLEQVGLYSMGYKLANTIKVIVVASAWYAITPLIYKMMNQPENKRFYSKIMTYFSFGLMFFILVISIFGKEVVYLFSLIAHKSGYQESYKIIPIIAFAIFFGMLKDVSTTGLNITKHTKIIALIIIVIAGLNLLLNILFIPYYHFVGAAIATLVSQIIFFIIILHFAQKKYPIPFEIKKVLLIIGVGLLLTIFANLINSVYLPVRLAVKILLIVAFPFILYPFHFYEKIELERLKQIWSTWKNPANWRTNIKRIYRQDADNPIKE